jgi:hypothetical protein
MPSDIEVSLGRCRSIASRSALFAKRLRIAGTQLRETGSLRESVFPSCFPSGIIAVLDDANASTRGGSCQRWFLGILLRFGSLPKTQTKFLRYPPKAAAFGRTRLGRVQGRLHRLRSCSRSTKEKTPCPKPVSKVSLYPVHAAIWRNENGKKGDAFYNVSFERSFKNEAGELQSSTSFGFGDLLTLAKVADLAHSRIVELRAGDRQAKQSEEQTA